ncbi:MAG: ATPase, T2SS/T4P/T4SS family [Candidatus Micrarchaeota archaeon]
MRLKLDVSKCTDCGACVSHCPKHPNSRKILLCRHCPPQSALCKNTCPKNAIVEIGNGLLAVDEKICDGCGLCECPYEALIFKKGLALKCDLCGGEPECVGRCPEDALTVFEDARDALGWCVLSDSSSKYKINIPQLSADEEKLIARITDEFREISKKEEISDDREFVKRKIDWLIKSYCARENILMEKSQFAYLSEIALMNIYGYGVLDSLLADDELEEIAVVGINKPIYVYHRRDGWLTTNAAFTRDETLVNTINKMARPLGRRITFQTPRLNAVLPDGSRMHASIPPISNLELTIRKFRRNPISVVDLINLKTFTSESLAFLWMLFQSDISALISGNTSCGKTSTLNALFSFVPLGERILITEETPEINIPHEHVVKLLANREIGIPMGELVADSLRMRPDRVIVGEVRTAEEVGALFETILSGQARGSYATFHAQSAHETLARLRSLGVLQMDIGSLDIIVVQRRMLRYNPKTCASAELRRATEICELIPNGDALPKANVIFEYDFKTDRLERRNSDSKIVERVSRNFGISESEFERELGTRENFLKHLCAKKFGFFETVGALQKFSSDEKYKKKFTHGVRG